MLQTSLETESADKPNLTTIVNELEQAQSDATTYLGRLERCRKWWHCEWKGQYFDGKKHAEGETDVVTPWEGASDSRLRIVQTLINDHISISKQAFWGARVSVKSTRPFVYGRIANIAQKVLQWHVYTQMRQEVMSELWFAWAWKLGFGLSFISVEWEQQRAVSMEKITLDDLNQISQKLDMPELMDFGGGDADEAIVEFFQKLSPILAKDDARKIISEIRNDGISFFPVITMPINKPKWTALMPCGDVVFPSETSDIQTARWVSRRELVNESELKDRIETDGYDADFVEEAIKHKGDFADFTNNPGWYMGPTGSERDQIELHHFLHRNIENGVPTMYRTIFNPAVAKATLKKELVAVHRVFEYQHQKYPMVALRRTRVFRPLLTSVGLSEEAYTDEQDIKAQQDGLTDRTELINSPPMILPTLRAVGISSSYGPRAVMSALRPKEVTWAPLPPSDNTPVAVIEMVQNRLDRRYSISGPTVDPQIRVIRQQELANDVHTEIELILEQTLKLAQQFDTDDVVNRVAGQGGQPWNVGVNDIQGDHEISVTMDMRTTDVEYVKEKLDMFSKALGMNQAGTANMTKIFSRVMAIVDPDAEDLVEEDQQSATEKEIAEEDAATAQILVGMEPRKPMYGNHQLRLERLISNTIQSPNPFIQETIGSRKDVQMLLKNRIAFHKNQIQQHQLNPQIGRSLSTKTFEPTQPAEVGMLQ